MTQLRKTCRMGNPCSILLVENQITIADAIQRGAAVYEPGCFHFAVASTLEEAGKRFGSILYDLVILDLGLPDSNGIATFLTLRDIVRGRAPIAVLTGEDDEEIEIRCIEQGAIAYVVKPVLSVEHFLRRARGWILKYRRDMQERDELLRDNKMLQQVQEKILEGPAKESVDAVTEVAERLFAMARSISSRYEGKGHVATH